MSQIIVRADYQHRETGQVVHKQEFVSIDDALIWVQGQLGSLWALPQLDGWVLRIYRSHTGKEISGE